MRGVHVAADDDLFAIVFQLVEVGEELVVEVELELEALLRHPAVGEVAVDEHERAVVGDDRAALGVEALDPEAALELLGLALRIERDAAVTLPDL